MNGVFRHHVIAPKAGVVFPFTVEIMGAIVAGLVPKSGDAILSVTGCGDQVFALLERGARVIAIDINPSQLTLLRERKEALIRDDSLSGFYGSPILIEDCFKFQNRLKYFDNNRYYGLRKNLHNLEILPPISLEEITAKRKFNKIYASDAIGELYSKDKLGDCLLSIVRGLEDDGLLYVSNGPEINNLVEDISRCGLQKDLELTLCARKLEDFYVPNVYRKVTEV